MAVHIDLCGLGGIGLHALSQGKRVHLAQLGVVLNDGRVRAVTKHDPRPFGAGLPARGVVGGVEGIHEPPPACLQRARRPGRTELTQEAGRQRLEQRHADGTRPAAPGQELSRESEIMARFSPRRRSETR